MKPGRHAYARRMARHLRAPEPVVDPVARLPDVSPDGQPCPTPTWLHIERVLCAHTPMTRHNTPNIFAQRGTDDDENAW